MTPTKPHWYIEYMEDKMYGRCPREWTFPDWVKHKKGPPPPPKYKRKGLKI